MFANLDSSAYMHIVVTKKGTRSAIHHQSPKCRKGHHLFCTPCLHNMRIEQVFYCFFLFNIHDYWYFKRITTKITQLYTIIDRVWYWVFWIGSTDQFYWPYNRMPEFLMSSWQNLWDCLHQHALDAYHNWKKPVSSTGIMPIWMLPKWGKMYWC